MSKIVGHYSCTFPLVADQLNGQDRKVNRKNRLHAVPLKKFHSAFCYDINSCFFTRPKIFTKDSKSLSIIVFENNPLAMAIQTFSTIHADSAG